VGSDFQSHGKVSKMKVCGKCKEERETDCFHKNKNTKDGIQAWCKDCMKVEHGKKPDFYREYSKRWHEENKEDLREKQNLRRTTKRESILFEQARHRAAKNGIPFNIDLSDIVIPDICPILGVALSIETGKGRTGTSPSLDRIIPALGYVKGNIAIISDQANTIKSFGTAEQHRLIADWMDSQKEPDARTATA
jgi:hypothetical protein